MKTLEYRTEDKSKWPRGEWDDEPDKVQWQDEETGLPCMLVRNRMGALCGYVGLSPSHPFYEKGYDDGPNDKVNVHMGFTFAEFCQDKTGCPDLERLESEGICHVVEEGEEEKIWWLGFDCNHAWDFAPGYHLPNHFPRTDETYKNVHFVKQECASVAMQLKKVEHGNG